MTETRVPSPNRPGRRLRKEPPKRDRLTRRLALQLAAALAAFGLWLGLCRGFPDQAGQWRETLSHLLTGTQDLWSACRQLGEDLAQGEKPAEALEDWCAQVFLPSGLQQPEGPEGEGDA